jgi:formate dehydrogenase subunit gamma
MSNYVERFSTGERVLHWFVTAAFFTLLLSGLGLYSRLFTGYFDFFGGGRNAILFHKIAGVLFFCSSLLLFLSHRKEVSSFDADDRHWLTRRGGYLSRNEEHFNSGKFNAGQKLFGLFIGATTLVLGISGIFIWAPTSFPRPIVQVSLFIHGLSFVLAVMFAIIHVYLATIGNPGTLEGMLYGRVRRIWARKHHPKWYREVGEE